MIKRHLKDLLRTFVLINKVDLDMTSKEGNIFCAAWLNVQISRKSRSCPPAHTVEHQQQFCSSMKLVAKTISFVTKLQE